MARKSSQILFYSSVSTTCVPEELLKGRNKFFHVTHTCNGKRQTPTGPRPYTAFSSKERHIHASVHKHFCSKEKVKNDSDKNGDETLRKNEQSLMQNNKLKVNKSKFDLLRKRNYYKIRHQNLVWDESNKRNRFNKYKMFTSISEINKELAENKLNNTYSALHKNPELQSNKESKNTEVLKAQDSSAKNILTIDIFPDSNNIDIAHSSQFKTLADDNINANSKINTKTSSSIKNSGKLISSKEAGGNNKNNWKIKNDNSLINKSTIKDLKTENLTLLNQNKVPINERIKNIKDEDNSISFHNKDHCMNVSNTESIDNRAFKVTKCSLQNKINKEMIKEENSKYKFINRSKSGIVESKDNLDDRKINRADEGKGTVWNTIYRQKKPQMVSNDLEYHTYLQNKIQGNYKNIDLNQRFKFASSINSILRPAKAKAQIPSERCDYQLLPKNVNAPFVASVNSIRNIAQQMSHTSNLVMDNTLYLKLLKIGTSRLNEVLKNSNDNYPFLNVSRDKPQNKIQLIKDINSANSNKMAMVTGLKCEIQSWKKYEYLKKAVLESTSQIYQSIMNNKRIGNITKNTIYTPRKKTKQKCTIISIPLTPYADINKCRKTSLTQMKTNCLKYQSSFSSKPDPIKTLNFKYKKNYQTTYNDLLKKNEIFICQEKFKRNPEILAYDQKQEFQIEMKSGVVNNIDKEMFKGNHFKKPEEQNVKVLMKSAKKISPENKKSWVRYMHQMNDESNGESSKVTEISTYPSGFLKKPEFIIEILPCEDKHCTEMEKLTQFNTSDSQTGKGNLNTTTKRSNSKESCKLIVNNTFNKQNEKCESSIIAETSNKLKFNKIGKECEDIKLNIEKYANGKGKSISFSDLCKVKSDPVCESKHTVCEKKHTVSKKKHLIHQTRCPLYSPLDQEHCLSYETFEDIEPKVNTIELNNDSSIEEVKKVNKVGSEEPLKVNNSENFQTKRNVDNKISNEISSDCDSINLKCDQSLTNNIKVEVSNIIYEPPIRTACNGQVLPEENKIAVIDKQHPKFTISSVCIQENIPIKNNSLVQNQSEFSTIDPSKQIKPMLMKTSSHQLHAIEISIDASQPQPSVSKEPKKSQETQIEYLTKATSKPESKNNMEFSNICGNQDLNSCKIPNMNEYQRGNNFCCGEQFSSDLKLQNSNFDQNVNNHLENVNNTPTEVLGEEITISNGSTKKGLAKQVKAPTSILSSNDKNIKKKNLRTNLEFRKTSSDNDHQISQQNPNVEQIKNFQNFLHHFKQSNSYKAENINADINKFKFFSFLEKRYSEISSSKNNKNAFIDNIKEFFRTSCNYFKFDEGKVSIDHFLSNSQFSKVKYNSNHGIPNSYREIKLSSKEPASFPKIDTQLYISSEYSKPDFYQKGINHNIRRNEIKVLPSYLPNHGKEDTSLSGNDEFKKRFSNKLSVSSKGDFPTTSKDLEHLIPNETRRNENNIFRKCIISKTDNTLCKNSSFLNKITDKDFESFSANEVKQQGSFCNLNHKKSYMKFSSKNRLYNQKSKLRFAKANVINIKNKLRGFHHSMNSNMSFDEIPNLVKSRKNRRNEMITFKWNIGLKPIMKNSKKLKKDHSYKLYSDTTINLRATDKSNLLKTLKSFQKLSDKSNPESYWLNCFSKNNFTEDKLSCNEFLTYIKRRKLPRKSSLKCNN